MTTRVRIAPSPTGPLHIGTARTALFNYLFARQTGGTFVLRMEDTDLARSTPESEADILDGLHWLGLDWDEGPGVAGSDEVGPHGPYRQSGRTGSYAAAALRLLDKDRAYPCFCTSDELSADRAAQQADGERAHYVGRCARLTPAERAEREAEGRASVLRFRLGEGTVTFEDLVRGSVSIDIDTLGGDLVIVRSDGSPLYHFTVVVDDIAMHISHVIRGEDHLSNTPKHVLLFRALGAEPPVFAHLPLILNPDRSKMSKRKSQTAVSEYREHGYLPEAMVNHLALLGWSSGTDDDVFSLADLEERFGLERVQPSGAIFDAERLDWLNGQWIRRLPDDDLIERLMPRLVSAMEATIAAGRSGRIPDADELRGLLPLIRERLPKLDAVGPALEFVFVDEVDPDPAEQVPKRWDTETTLAGLVAATEHIETLGRDHFETEGLEADLRVLAEERGWKVGDLFMSIRVAVTGSRAAPPLFDTLVALGYERSLERLRRAHERLIASSQEEPDAAES